MTLPLDISTWSEDRIKEELAARLPRGWAFSLLKDVETQFWVVRIFCGAIEHWSGEDIAPNLALLHALGWVTLQTVKPKANGLWVRKAGELTPERVHELAYRVSSPDPEPADLDPAEVGSVYEKARKPK